MKDCRVIGIARILHVKLPIVRQDLMRVTGHLDRAIEDAPYMRTHFRTEIGFDLFEIAVEGAEDQPAEILDTHALEPVLAKIEIRRHAARAGEPALKRDRGEVAAEVIGPGVVNTGKLLALAGRLDAQHRAFMRASVDERVNGTLLVANDDDRCLTDKARAIVSGLG